MVRRLAGGGRAIVTAEAIAAYAAMVERRAGEGRGRFVAILTHVR